MSLEHYTDSDLTDHEVAKAYLREQLLATHADHTIPATELAEHVPVSASTVRDLIQDLREEGLPVWSGPRGYYVIQSGAELDSAIESINEQIATMEHTKQQLCRNMKY